MLERNEHGSVLELQLSRPPVNALDGGLIKALREAVENAPGEGHRALVLSGAPGMFSAGLDVPALLQLDRKSLMEVWEDFFGLMAALARSPIPVCAAVTGHSPAGGAVIAIFCDYRIMADGEYQIGLNEVQVGLEVPEPICRALARLVGPYRAERLLVSGAMLTGREASQAGLVDDLVQPETVVEQSIAWCEGLLELPQGAMSGTRAIARADLARLFDHVDQNSVESLADAWFSDETQQTMKALVARLQEKKEQG